MFRLMPKYTHVYMVTGWTDWLQLPFFNPNRSRQTGKRISIAYVLVCVLGLIPSLKISWYVTKSAICYLLIFPCYMNRKQ